MSFRFYKTGTQEDVKNDLGKEENSVVPEVVKGFVQAAMDGYHNDKQMVSVLAYGHIHDGTDNETSSLQITVEKINQVHPDLLPKEPNKKDPALKVSPDDANQNSVKSAAEASARSPNPPATATSGTDRQT